MPVLYGFHMTWFSLRSTVFFPRIIPGTNVWVRIVYSSSGRVVQAKRATGNLTFLREPWGLRDFVSCWQNSNLMRFRAPRESSRCMMSAAWTESGGFIFWFTSTYLGKWSYLTSIFQTGWNQHLADHFLWHIPYYASMNLIYLCSYIVYSWFTMIYPHWSFFHRKHVWSTSIQIETNRSCR